MTSLFKTPKTLKEVSQRASSPKDFHYHLSNAIDHFNQISLPTEKEDFVFPEPIILSTKCQDDGYCDAFLGAACQRLCEWNNINYPSWIFEKERYLKNPVFSKDSQEGRLYVLIYSSPAFKSRNLFVLDSVLLRT